MPQHLYLSKKYATAPLYFGKKKMELQPNQVCNALHSPPPPKNNNNNNNNILISKKDIIKKPKAQSSTHGVHMLLYQKKKKSTHGVHIKKKGVGGNNKGKTEMGSETPDLQYLWLP
jgi:hypothetical protein